MDPSICESCWHYDYDEELDEDEFERTFSRPGGMCRYYQKGDDYYLPRHQ